MSMSNSGLLVDLVTVFAGNISSSPMSNDVVARSSSIFLIELAIYKLVKGLMSISRFLETPFARFCILDVIVYY